jgi:hypothetical protein
MVVVKGVDTRFKAVEVANAVHQGTVSDHDRWIKGDDSGTKRYVKVDAEGKLQTVAAAGTATIGNIDRVGTVGDIAHLGSIANTRFDQGSISDHIRYIYGWEAPGTARFVKVNGDGKLETVSVIESGTVKVSNMPSDYTKPENDYDFQSYDLNTGRASPGSTLGQAGESLTVFELSGSCSLRFNGTAKPAIPVNELTYPQMVVFERTYTNVYLQNTSQSGKTVKLYFGKRV